MISYDLTAFGAPLARNEQPTPTPTGSQVLVRVLAAGVCHSDIHIRHGYYDMGNGKRLNMGDRGAVLPLTMGHETAGEIVAVGPDAREAKIGQRVVVYPWLGCGQCKVCARGQENLCLKGRSLGVFAPGGYADHILVPHARYLVDIGDMAPEQAAPCACSGLTMYSAIGKIDPAVLKDEHVVVFGAGGLGLMAVGLLKALGNPGAIVIEPDAAKRAAALKAGAAHAIDSAAPDAAEQAKAAAGGAVWAALDCVGTEQTVGTGIAMLTKGGQFVQVGLFGGKVEISTPSMPMRAVSYEGSYVGNLGQLRALIDLAKAGKLVPLPIDARPLDQAEAALQDLEAGKVVGRVMLKPN
ncbi:NAD-dependent alcohol dehydrogenase [Pseudorhodoferax aquiterrae]|uniref:alcohol dehydrogenase n=1 Tax=Pseudorhodoferax aquiterrae TaxID=747304 RepID=A0ABQ3FUS2_9BURK|nr:alcohol dehydrogenase [Pseudorhodoferax aquiterrae]GHC69373.1 NAD-dependent alcohol dehydrogenase [Pseudorhodoferax aquiterrae]